MKMFILASIKCNGVCGKNGRTRIIEEMEEAKTKKEFEQHMKRKRPELFLDKTIFLYIIPCSKNIFPIMTKLSKICFSEG